MELVSVIMPSFNNERFIGDAIDSVLKQSYENWELIIVDDCSSDDTDTVVSSFIDPRIVYIKNDKNRGAAYCRNTALRMAHGRWVAFLDSDDLWDPSKLEKQVQFMEEHGYHFSYTAYEEIDNNSKPLNRLIIGPKKITKRGMMRYCWPGCLTVMFDACIVGLIQIKEIRKNNDYAIWLSVVKKADCFFLDENLAKYRRGRAGSISSAPLFELIKWHYRLFRECENNGRLLSFVKVLINLFYGVIKKTFYCKKIKDDGTK